MYWDRTLLSELGIEDPPQVGIILGTGWGDLLPIEGERSIPFFRLDAFRSLPALDGHKRLICAGKVAGKSVVALRGRIHLNEGVHNFYIAHAVRAQVEILMELGIETFIITNAAGALGNRANVGDVVAVDGFVIAFAPDLPLNPGEFCSPDSVLDEPWRTSVLSLPDTGLALREGGYAMFRGPCFEGRYDKQLLLHATQASCVGMSSLPEAAVLATKPGNKALVLSYITNSDSEVHSHEENVRRAKADGPKLSALLTRIIAEV